MNNTEILKLPKSMEELYLGGPAQLLPDPVISDEQFGECNFRIYDSVQYGYAITVSYWQPVRDEWGRMEKWWGMVTAIDADHHRIKLVNDGGDRWIEVERIRRVDTLR